MHFVEPPLATVPTASPLWASISFAHLDSHVFACSFSAYLLRLSWAGWGLGLSTVCLRSVFGSILISLKFAQFFSHWLTTTPEHGATTTMLYCGNGVLWVSSVEFMPNVSLRANASMLYFGLSIPKKLFFQHMISYLSCSPLKLLQSYILPLCFFSD